MTFNLVLENIKGLVLWHDGGIRCVGMDVGKCQSEDSFVSFGTKPTQRSLRARFLTRPEEDGGRKVPEQKRSGESREGVLYSHNHNDINNNGTTNTHSNTQYKYRQKQADSVVSDTNGLLISWLQSFDTRRDTQFLKVFANHTIWLYPNAWRILWCLRYLSVEICKTPTTCLTVENSQ